MSAHAFPVEGSRDLSNLRYLRGFDSIEYKVTIPRAQRWGEFVGRTLRAAVDSKLGQLATQALKALAPSNGQPYQPKHAERPWSEGPRAWADLCQPEPGLGLSDADHDLLVAAGAMPYLPGQRPASEPKTWTTGDTEFDNVTAGLFTDVEQSRIDAALAASQGPTGPMLVEPRNASDHPTGEYQTVGSR